MVHCNQRGCEIIVGDNSHTFRFEQGNTNDKVITHSFNLLKFSWSVANCWRTAGYFKKL